MGRETSTGLAVERRVILMLHVLSPMFPRIHGESGIPNVDPMILCMKDEGGAKQQTGTVRKDA